MQYVEDGLLKDERTSVRPELKFPALYLILSELLIRRLENAELNPEIRRSVNAESHFDHPNTP